MTNRIKMIRIRNLKNLSIGIIIAVVLSGCASNLAERKHVNSSYLTVKKQTELNNTHEVSFSVNGNEDKSDDNKLLTSTEQNLNYVAAINNTNTKKSEAVDLTQQFSDDKMVKMTADDLPLKDYLHYVLGEILKVSYIVSEEVSSEKRNVTLNIQQEVSEKKLFTLTDEVLSERGFVIRYNDGVFYVNQESNNGSQGNIVFGYGKNISDIPLSTSEIIQFVPFEYGYQSKISLVLRSVAKVTPSLNPEHNAVTLKGKRQEIIKAIEFINMIDQPSFRKSEIGIYNTTFTSTDVLKEKLTEIFFQEGISVSSDRENNKAISIVSLDRIGALIFFAPNRAILERIEFWSKKIDKPAGGNEVQYFIYPPKFARAADLGESIQGLIGSNSISQSNDNTTSAASQNRNRNKVARNKSNSASNSDVSLVIDEKANALIFMATGDKYRKLLPLIKRLDVMPKQVILEVMIAEVKLTDTFKQGVDFVLTNQGSAQQAGGFTLSSGAKGLSYALKGVKGELNFNLLQTNVNVNVLSRPSLLVRDGVTANITVGDDIPTVGEIITDPTNGSKSSVVYRKTGVELRVKPTVNASSVIIMEIAQKISNQETGDDSVAGSPIIFERSISTEVVAESGQTIILGGLISEKRTVSDTSVPFFSSIPLVGKLFDSEKDEGDKTELIVMVTPRVIESSEEWEDIKTKFASEFNNLNINQ